MRQHKLIKSSTTQHLCALPFCYMNLKNVYLFVSLIWNYMFLTIMVNLKFVFTLSTCKFMKHQAQRFKT